MRYVYSSETFVYSQNLLNYMYGKDDRRGRSTIRERMRNIKKPRTSEHRSSLEKEVQVYDINSICMSAGVACLM